MHLLEKYHRLLTKYITPELMADIVPVNITPAAKWFLGESPQDFWNYREDFPCVLPPAPVTWIEYEMPAFIHSESRTVERPARSVAALIMALEIPEEERHDFLVKDEIVGLFNFFRRRSQILEGVQVSYDRREEAIQEALKAGLTCKWVCLWQLFGEPLNYKALVPYMTYAMPLDEGGQILNSLSVAHSMVSKEEKQGDLSFLSNVFSDSLAFLFGLSLMHCRNVEVIEQEISATIAKRRKEKGIPLIRFKHLIIKPMGQRKVKAGESMTKQQGMMPMHFVRAHFKTYTADKPLMGKHVGRYFWHTSARGNRKMGEIVKDYQVEKE